MINLGQNFELNEHHNLKAAIGMEEQTAIEVEYVKWMNAGCGRMNLISLIVNDNDDADADKSNNNDDEADNDTSDGGGGGDSSAPTAKMELSLVALPKQKNALLKAMT